MLKITRKVEYALIALRHLQQNDEGQLCSAKTLSLEYGIPKELLAKILQKLSKENIILSVKGPKGGYKISKDNNIDTDGKLDLLSGIANIELKNYILGKEQLSLASQSEKYELQANAWLEYLKAISG